MAYLLSDKSAEWLREQMGREGEPRKRQYIPRFPSRRGGGDGSAKILKITGGDALHGYEVDVFEGYRQYLDNQTEGEAVFFPTEIAMDGELPLNSLCVGHSMELLVTGGSESV